MADYKVTDTELTSIANAIRTKGGTQAQLEFPTGFVSAVQAIPTGGGGSSFDGTLIGEYNNSSDSAGGKWTSTNHDTTNDIGYVVAYYYNSNLIKIITLKKEKITSPINGAFEHIAAELTGAGSYLTHTGFNMRIVNGILEISFGSVSSGAYSAKVYTCGSALDYFGPLYSE